MSTRTDTPHPTPTSLSQLMRLIGEKNLTDPLLNQLFTTGLLARLFETPDPTAVNITAFERVLGFPEEVDPHLYTIPIDMTMTMDALLRKGSILTKDMRHYELAPGTVNIQGRCKMGLTRTGRVPRWGQVLKKQEAQGLRPANLMDLLFFACEMSIGKLGHFPIYALSARTKGEQPHVYYIQELPEDGHPTLIHVDSYSTLPVNAQFLGVLIES